MRLSKSMTNAVRFAYFAAAHEIDPRDLAELVTLSQRAFSAGERECNTGKDAGPARLKVEGKANTVGFSTEWNGLWPSFVVIGKDGAIVDRINSLPFA
jgi:hypothetical protein